MMLRIDEATGRAAPSRTAFSLPANREDLLDLKFDRIAYYMGLSEAVMLGPDDALYGVKESKIDEVLATQRLAKGSGALNYELAQFQLAKHAFANSAMDRRIRKGVYEVEEKTLIGGILATGLTFAASAFITMFNLNDNINTLDAFSDNTAVKLAGQDFQAKPGVRQAALGDPKKGAVSWNFSGDVEVCAVQPLPRDTLRAKFYALSWLSQKHQYQSDCRPLADWPQDSVAQKSFVPAYTAYLQASKPEAGYTPETVASMLQARRDIMAAHPQLKVTLP